MSRNKESFILTVFIGIAYVAHYAFGYENITSHLPLNAPSIHRHHRKLENGREGIFVVSFEEYSDSSRREILNFQLDDGTVYEIENADNDWFQTQRAKGRLKSGETRIKIDVDTLNSGQKIHLLNGTPDIMIDDTGSLFQRRLVSTIGERSVLVVRVKANDVETTASEDELRDKVFGTDGDALNLKSQVAACSYDQLSMNPSASRSGTSTAITDGVVTITIDSNVSGLDRTVVENLVTTELNSQFGVESPGEIADHVMYCLPNGLSPSGWTVSTYFGSYFSSYKNKW